MKTKDFSYDEMYFNTLENNLNFTNRALSHNEKSKILNTLHLLNQLLGFATSSFWCIDDDCNLSNPISTSFRSDILLEYEKNLYIYDEFHPSKWLHTNTDSSVIIHDSIRNQCTPYYRSLEEYDLEHKCSIMLKDDNHYWGSIAFFSSRSDSKELSELDFQRLMDVVPFAKETIKAHLLYETLQQNTFLLQNTIDKLDTGIILFEKDTKNILYYNSKSISYCANFLSSTSSQSIIHDFVMKYITPLGKSFTRLNNMTLDLVALNGNIYSISIENNSTTNNVFAIFISPQAKGNSPIKNGKLFLSFTGKEREIVMLITQGYTNSEIAQEMYISISTVKTHIQHIFEKANVNNRSSLLAVLREDL